MARPSYCRFVAASIAAVSSGFSTQAAQYTLTPSPQTVHIGHFAANVKPVLTINSGDIVAIETAGAIEPAAIDESGVVPPAAVPQYVRDIYRDVKDRGPGPHVLTGPIAINGAMPGDVLDNKDLGAGSILYMPVHAAGALFSTGDAHAAQGHGEVDLSAIETGLRGRFQFIVRRDMKLVWPRGETPTHWIVMGLHPNLEEAMKIATRETIDFITKRFPHLTLEEAYMIASVAVDYHVTQVVDGTKGIHGMIPKSIFTAQ
jgi:acetamidase/formamidase